MKTDEELEPPTGWQWLGGCLVGAVLGALGAPLALLLLFGLLAYFDPDGNAEAAPLLLLICVPLGAILGALCAPFLFVVSSFVQAKIRRTRAGR